MAQEIEYREIYTSKEEFDKLRSDVKFAKLLNLARAVNAIYFCFNALLDYSGNLTPAGQRQTLNAFLFATGALNEGFKVADTLAKHFGERASYQNGFAKLLSDPQIKELRRTILARMRNKFVFHYDEDVARKTLKSLDLPYYLFATGTGSKRKGTYYNLADEIVINYLLRDIPAEDEQDRRFRQALDEVGKALSAYVDCADALIADVLPEGAWKVRKGTNRIAVS
ncbi:MAG: hypothetical protein QOE77_2495 [Blastocatellia bacterium]|jgi:hypothetical protein|nr:hypothetical protein [Blastocatellia bacterium]